MIQLRGQQTTYVVTKRYNNAHIYRLLMRQYTYNIIVFYFIDTNYML